MVESKGEIIRYRRSRFSAKLRADLRYTPGHCWLEPGPSGSWRVGYTRFAQRMLGELVEFELKQASGSSVSLGQSIGWIEGFKALSDIYAAATGAIVGSNPELDRDITLFDRDGLEGTWLYAIEGEPDPNSMDVHGYIGILDTTIDQMLAEQGQPPR